MNRRMYADERSREQQRAHLDHSRKRRFRRIALFPFLMVLGIGFAYLGFALSLQSPTQVSVLSNAVLTLLLLCPAAVCLFPLVILSIALVALMNRWQRATVSPLRRLEAWTAVVEGSADKWLGRVDERVLEAAVAFAPIRQLLRTFDTLADEEHDEDMG